MQHGQCARSSDDVVCIADRAGTDSMLLASLTLMPL